MALMEWATDVPQKLLQCDAIHFKFIINNKFLRSCGANQQRKL